MQLQQLIGELQALALAYPAETPVVVQNHDFDSDVVGVVAVSTGDGIVVKVDIQ
jgi:hypothetical protein